MSKVLSFPIGFIVFTVSEVITHLLFTPLKQHSTLLLICPSSPWRTIRKTPSQIFGPTSTNSALLIQTTNGLSKIIKINFVIIKSG